MNQKQIEKEWAKIIKAEEKFLNKNIQKKEADWQLKLEKYIPEKVSDNLNEAFYKAFEMIFEKGTGLIEKTYDKEKRKKEHQVHAYAAETLGTRKSLKVFAKQAKSSKNTSTMLSLVEGIGMGIAGAGLPDIPIFLSVLLRSIYEIAVIYGFDYDTEQEQIFILKLIETALTHEDELLEGNAQLNAWVKTPFVFPVTKEEQIKRTSLALSDEMLYLKFVQGAPVVGVVGGVSDVVYQRKIIDYAEMKYKRRFFAGKREKWQS